MGITFIGAGISLIVAVTISLELGIVGVGICAIIYGIRRMKQEKVAKEVK